MIGRLYAKITPSIFLSSLFFTIFPQFATSIFFLNFLHLLKNTCCSDLRLIVKTTLTSFFVCVCVRACKYTVSCKYQHRKTMLILLTFHLWLKCELHNNTCKQIHTCKVTADRWNWQPSLTISHLSMQTGTQMSQGCMPFRMLTDFRFSYWKNVFSVWIAYNELSHNIWSVKDFHDYRFRFH